MYVVIILGSDSDKGIVHDSGMTKILDETGCDWRMSVISAHRNPEKLKEYVEKNLDSAAVFIGIAGMSAALPGAIAAYAGAMVPVIGVPLASDDCPDGSDALLSMVQMPPGMPVLVPGKGKTGLKKAAIAAAQIVALDDDEVERELRRYLVTNQKPVKIDFDSNE